MEYYTYALWSLTRRELYIGFSKDVDKRIKQHNSMVTKSTKSKAPWVLILKVKHNSLKQARANEVYWKQGFNREMLRQLAKRGFFNKSIEPDENNWRHVLNDLTA